MGEGMGPGLAVAVLGPCLCRAWTRSKGRWRACWWRRDRDQPLAQVRVESLGWDGSDNVVDRVSSELVASFLMQEERNERRGQQLGVAHVLSVLRAEILPLVLREPRREGLEVGDELRMGGQASAGCGSVR